MQILYASRCTPPRVSPPSVRPIVCVDGQPLHVVRRFPQLYDRRAELPLRPHSRACEPRIGSRLRTLAAGSSSRRRNEPGPLYPCVLIRPLGPSNPLPFRLGLRPCEDVADFAAVNVADSGTKSRCSTDPCRLNARMAWNSSELDDDLPLPLSRPARRTRDFRRRSASWRHDHRSRKNPSRRCWAPNATLLRRDHRRPRRPHSSLPSTRWRREAVPPPRAVSPFVLFFIFRRRQRAGLALSRNAT